jgi:hypothetical protein
MFQQQLKSQYLQNSAMPPTGLQMQMQQQMQMMAPLLGSPQASSSFAFADGPASFGSLTRQGAGISAGGTMLAGNSIVSASEAEFMVRQVQTGGLAGAALSALTVGEAGMEEESVATFAPAGIAAATMAAPAEPRATPLSESEMMLPGGAGAGGDEQHGVALADDA